MKGENRLAGDLSMEQYCSRVETEGHRQRRHEHKGAGERHPRRSAGTMAYEPLGQNSQKNQSEDKAEADRAQDHLHQLSVPPVEVNDVAR